jgi:hypothetical protein
MPETPRHFRKNVVRCLRELGGNRLCSVMLGCGSAQAIPPAAAAFSMHDQRPRTCNPTASIARHIRANPTAPVKRLLINLSIDLISDAGASGRYFAVKDSSGSVVRRSLRFIRRNMSANIQIDVVGLRDDGWVDLGECRWIGRSGLSSVARELAVRVGHFPGGNRTVRQLLFVRKKPASMPAGVLVHDLPSLYL